MTEIQPVKWTVKGLHGSIEIIEVTKNASDTSQRGHRRIIWVQCQSDSCFFTDR